MLTLLAADPLTFSDPAIIAFFVTCGLAVVLGILTKFLQWRNASRKKKPFVCPIHPAIDPPAGISAMPTNSPIDAVRVLMGPAPRVFPKSLQSYLTVMPPLWLKKNPNDEDWINIKNQDRVRRDGLIVWATTVQANNYLFKQVNVETGASVIYSPDPWFDPNRHILREIADRCFALKGTDPADPESAAFARMLTSELVRGMRLKVPRVFTGNREVYHSSMFMPRKHLPKGTLSGTFFPVWIDREKTGATLMVPAAYWPASLLAEWDRD